MSEESVDRRWQEIQRQYDIQRNPWRARRDEDDDLIQWAMGYVLELDEDNEAAAARQLAELKSMIGQLDRDALERLFLYQLLEYAREGLDRDDDDEDDAATED